MDYYYYYLGRPEHKLTHLFNLVSTVPTHSSNCFEVQSHDSQYIRKMRPILRHIRISLSQYY